MGYLLKESLLNAYKELSHLSADPTTQGATQKVSALRYFIALDQFYCKYNKGCNTMDFSDKESYTEYVGNIVAIDENVYTTNFYYPLKDSEGDYNCGSNFYSVNVVKESKVNTSLFLDFPRRGGYPLIKLKNGELIREIKYYDNLNYYLNNSSKLRTAFVIWLLRADYIPKNNYEGIKLSLLNKYSKEMVEILMPAKEETEYSKYLKFTNNKEIIESLDIKNILEIGHKTYKPQINSTDCPYITAIRTKPFLLLAGISGTGKSRIVKKLAFDTCTKEEELRKDLTSPGNYQLIEVKPNWHDSTEVLGYESEIEGVHYVTTPFIKFLVKAMCYPDTPFFACMDEMNLAPVEQYFAEFLSVLESRQLLDDGRITSEPLIKADVFNKKYDSRHDIFEELGLKKVPTSVGKAENDKLGENATTEPFDRQDIVQRLQKEGLRLPQNIIVVGTVNMDETTHQFSRKVIDRAMTIEMNIAEGAEPFTDFFNKKEELQYRSEPISKDLFLPVFVQASEAMESLNEDDCKYLTENVPQKLSELNVALDNTPFKIAYRVQNELVLYFTSLRQVNEETTVEELFSSALDGILMMKVLPRIEGDEDLLEKPLKELANYTQELAQSAKKIEEMKKRLERVHFTSFWP